MKEKTTGNGPGTALGLALRRLWDDESGAIALETVLVFPIQLLLTLMIIQAAYIWAAAGVINYAAFQAARVYMIEPRDGGDAQHLVAHRKAWNAAYIATSVLANPIQDAASRVKYPMLRTLHHEYYMLGGHPLGNNNGLQVYIGEDSRLSESVDDIVVTAGVRYYFPLTVPLAGGIMGLFTSGNILKNIRYIPMEQVVSIPKPWPY